MSMHALLNLQLNQVGMTHAFRNAIFQCSLTPASDSKFNYSSFERDPLLLASKLSRATSSGRACQLAEVIDDSYQFSNNNSTYIIDPNESNEVGCTSAMQAYMLLIQSADLLRSGIQLTTAVTCLIRAFYISQGFVEVSSLYRIIFHDLLQPLIGETHNLSGCHKLS